MEKIQIYQVLNCNKTLYKILKQQDTFPVSLGFKIHKLIKTFEEVEEYIFEIMDMSFSNINWKNMTDEENMFYNKLLSEEIEIEINKIPKEMFEKNNELMLTIEDIDNLSLILC